MPYYDHEPAGKRKMKKIALILSEYQKELGKSSLKILDVGCGDGHLSAYMASLGHDVCGIDVSSEAIGAATKRYQKEKVEYKVQDVSKMESTYDVVTAFEVCEHVPELPFFLTAIQKRLNQNGLFLVSVPNGWSIEEMIRRVLQHTAFGARLKRFIRGKNILPKSDSQSHADSPHVHFFSLRKWKKVFQSHQFVIVRPIYGVSVFFKQLYYIFLRRSISSNKKTFQFLDRFDENLVKKVPKSFADGWIITMHNQK